MEEEQQSDELPKILSKKKKGAGTGAHAGGWNYNLIYSRLKTIQAPFEIEDNTLTFIVYYIYVLKEVMI